jgi:4-carboxymuconolactone decarboxylase
MRYRPDTYQHFERVFPNVHAAHQKLARSCYETGPLEERTPGSSSSGLQLVRNPREPCARTRAALAEEMRAQELRHVGLLALTTIGFPHTMAGLNWIEEVGRKQILSSHRAARGPRLQGGCAQFCPGAGHVYG